MDIVLVGLPGSGKSEVGRLLAARLGAAFVDLDAVVEGAAGVTIRELFEREGEDGFRARERDAVAALGPAAAGPEPRRVIAAGGGAVVDPRNRWRLYRGRQPLWLDAPADVLAARLASSAVIRPLLVGGDLAVQLEALRAARLPFYAACPRVDADGDPAAVVARAEAAIAEATLGATPSAASGRGATLLRVLGPAGRLVLGEANAVDAVEAELRSLDARRAILVSEPGAWSAAGQQVAAGLERRGWRVEHLSLPAGEDAKRLDVVASLASDLANRRVERDEPIVAIGGGALTDVAGFVAATYARGVPWIAVPTTLVGQIDAAIGGKTAVDLPEGKNLVGAFHQPTAIVEDVAVLATLPERDRRAALAEAVKTAVLGDTRLLELLETEGPTMAAGETSATERGVMAELVERCARFKLDVVARDPEERGERVGLNLGHSLGHAIEAAGGFGEVRHGEAVAYGLRAACRIGVRRGTIGEARAEDVERLLDALGLGTAPLPYAFDAVLRVLETDKKRRDERLRWVLPTEAGWTLDDEVPDEVVATVAQSVLAGRSTSNPADAAGAIAGAAR